MGALYYLAWVFGLTSRSDDVDVVGYTFGVTVDSGAMVANVRMSLEPSADEMTRLLIDAVWSSVGSLIPQEIIAWSGRDSRLLDATGTHAVYRNVLTSTVHTGLLCLAGDVRRCQDGL